MMALAVSTVLAVLEGTLPFSVCRTKYKVITDRHFIWGTSEKRLTCLNF